MKLQLQNTRSYPIAVIAFIFMLIINFVAIAIPLNGLSTGEVADLYPNFFIPAGLTFGIWSIIYGFLFVFLILACNRRNDLIVARILPYFTLTSILNLSWIIAWHYLMVGVSVVIMLGLLLVLIIIFKIIQSDKSEDLKINAWINISMTIYLAWISVATIANISAFLVSLNWRGGIMSEQIWTLIMMSVAALLAIGITSKFNVPYFSLVVIWAILGIFLRWYESDFTIVVYGSVFLIIIMMIHLIYVSVKTQVSARIKI